jgi:hypothetical protein
VQVEGLNDWVVKSIGGTLYLLFGAVALLLAIGCGNVSILLLARDTARQHELAGPQSGRTAAVSCVNCLPNRWCFPSSEPHWVC